MLTPLLRLRSFSRVIAPPRPVLLCCHSSTLQRSPSSSIATPRLNSPGVIMVCPGGGGPLQAAPNHQKPPFSECLESLEHDLPPVPVDVQNSAQVLLRVQIVRIALDRVADDRNRVELQHL